MILPVKSNAKLDCRLKMTRAIWYAAIWLDLKKSATRRLENGGKKK